MHLITISVLTILYAAVAGVIFKFLLQRYKLINSLKFIPGPPALPLIGNAIDLLSIPLTDLLQYFSELENKYGSVFKIWIGMKPFVFVQDVEIFEDILKSSKNIEKMQAYKFLDEVIGKGLPAVSGTEWATRRKLLTPCFHLEILTSFIPTMIEESIRLGNKLNERINETIVLEKFLKFTTMKLILCTSLGVDKDEEIDEKECSIYLNAIDNLMHILLTRIFSPLMTLDFVFKNSKMYQVLKENRSIMDSYVEKTIEQRKKTLAQQKMDNNHIDRSITSISHKERLSLLDLLLKEIANGNSCVTEEMIKAEISTTIVAGYDTTSISLGFTFHLLGHYPEIQKRIVDEVNEVMPDFEKNGVTIKQLNSLEYLEACIKESLRLYPTAAIIGRKLVQPVKTSLGTLSAGTGVFLNIFNMHHNPKIFPEPNKFNPERFLSDYDDRNPFSHVPFSAGLRNCIGKRYAMMDMKIIIATLLKRFEFESLEEQEKLKVNFELLLKPASGILVKIKNRI